MHNSDDVPTPEVSTFPGWKLDRNEADEAVMPCDLSPVLILWIRAHDVLKFEYGRPVTINRYMLN